MNLRKASLKFVRKFLKEVMDNFLISSFFIIRNIFQLYCFNKLFMLKFDRIVMRGEGFEPSNPYGTGP